MSESTSKSVGLFQRGLPPTTVALILELDKEIPDAMSIDVSRLDSESYRLDLACNVGQRRLVDRLLGALKKQQGGR